MTTSVGNNSVFRSFFEKQKLTGPNFIDWYKQLRLVLSTEYKEKYLEQPIPTAHVAAAPDQPIPPQALATYNEWVKNQKEIAVMILLTMDLEIQRNLAHLGANDMLIELKALYSKQAEHKLLQTVRDFHTCKQEEGQSVSSYVLKMKSYIDQLEQLQYALGKTVNELHTMLKLHEKTLPKKVDAPALHAIRAGKVQKNKNKKPFKAAKGVQGKGRGCGTHICNTTQGLRGSKKLNPRALSLYMGNGQREAVVAIGNYHLCLPRNCVSCMSGKMARKPYSHQVERAKDLLGLIHTGVCGPFRIVSRQGANYFVTFTDDFSPYGYVYLLKHKHEVFETFKVFQKEVKNQLGKTIKSLRSDQGEEDTNPSLDTSLNHEEDDQEINEPPSDINPIRRSIRTRRPRDRLCLYIDAEEHELRDLGEPANYKAALKDPESKKWLAAINVEMQSMKDNDVWELVELPPNAKIVGHKWLFKKKTDMDGAVHTFKSRLIIEGEGTCSCYKLMYEDLNESSKGHVSIDDEDCVKEVAVYLYLVLDGLNDLISFTQTYGVGYEETFSPVTDIRAIVFHIAIVRSYDYEIWQMDVKTAFLNGHLSEEVYMMQSEGNGIKRFDDEIKKFDFTQNRDEPCVYQKASGSYVTFLILYVDDILIMGNNIPMLQDVKSYLGKCFAMKDLGEAAYILGIKIYRDRSKRLIGLCQKWLTLRKNLKKILYGEIPTLLVLDHVADMVSGFMKVDNETYAQCFMLPDAGYLTDADDLRSQTGYVFVLNEGVVDWKSTKQSIFATSFTDAEYIVVFDASKEAVWIHKFIFGLNVVPTIEEPITMYCDNTRAIAIANDHGVTKGA
ncbi:retrotransposon protein, putative, ty1-copia subclass [Tanacetum coccineum]